MSLEFWRACGRNQICGSIEEKVSRLARTLHAPNQLLFASRLQKLVGIQAFRTPCDPDGQLRGEHLSGGAFRARETGSIAVEKEDNAAGAGVGQLAEMVYGEGGPTKSN